MPLRKIKMPGDATIIANMLPKAFVYPEHEDWSLRDEEALEIGGQLDAMRMVWPLIMVLRLFMPQLRHIMRGYVWEEDGQPVGMVNVTKLGQADTWQIGNVAVLPDYRRRGIARQLVEAAVEMARGYGARSIVLDVIDGNEPAYKLYQSLGFEHFTGSAELYFDRSLGKAPDDLPEGYELRLLGLTDWRPRYAVSLAVTPPEVTRYEPVTESRFRKSLAFRIFAPFLIRIFGSMIMPLAVSYEGEDIAVATINARRGSGFNDIKILLHPDHAAIARPLLEQVVFRTAMLAPGKRSEFSVSHWQADLIEAAVALGFERRYDYHRLGMVTNRKHG